MAEDPFGGGNLYTVKPVNVFDVSVPGQQALQGAQQMEMQRRELEAQASQKAADRSLAARQAAANRAAEKEMEEKRFKFEQQKRIQEQQQQQQKDLMEMDLEEAATQRAFSVAQAQSRRETGISDADEEVASTLSNLDYQEKQAQEEMDKAILEGDFERSNKARRVLESIGASRQEAEKALTVSQMAHGLTKMSASERVKLAEDLTTQSAELNSSLSASTESVQRTVDAIKSAVTKYPSGAAAKQLFGLENPNPEKDVDALTELVTNPEAVNTLLSNDEWDDGSQGKLENRKRVKEVFEKLLKNNTKLIEAAFTPQGATNGGMLNDYGMQVAFQAYKQVESENSMPGLKQLANTLAEYSIGKRVNRQGQPDVEGLSSSIESVFYNLQRAETSVGSERQKYLNKASSELDSIVSSGVNAPVFGTMLKSVFNLIGAERFTTSVGEVPLSQTDAPQLLELLYRRSQTERGLDVEQDVIDQIQNSQMTTPYHIIASLRSLSNSKGNIIDQMGQTTGILKSKNGKVYSSDLMNDYLIEAFQLLETSWTGDYDPSSGSFYGDLRLIDGILDNDPKTQPEFEKRLSEMSPEYRQLFVEVVKKKKKELESIPTSDIQSFVENQIENQGLTSGLMGSILEDPYETQMSDIEGKFAGGIKTSDLQKLVDMLSKEGDITQSLDVRTDEAGNFVGSTLGKESIAQRQSELAKLQKEKSRIQQERQDAKAKGRTARAAALKLEEQKIQAAMDEYKKEYTRIRGR